PARLYGQKITGGKVELLVERITGPHAFLAHIKTSKALKNGGIILLDKDYQIEILGRQDDLFVCETKTEVLELLNSIGHIPIPPYIKREDELSDRGRYQTVYAKHHGSVAAPTAGLHFDEEVMRSLQKKGIKIVHLTLHVG